MMDYFVELLKILNEMSPYLLLGFLISGILHVYVPKTLYARFLRRKSFPSVVGASILGVPLPLCSCGVIPTAVSLRKEGASDGATVAFLVSTPQTGIDSILATYSLLGLPFAIIRAVSSLVIGVFCGVIIDKFGGKQQTHEEKAPNCHCCCTHGHHHPKEQKKSLKAVFEYGYINMMQDFGKWLVIGLLIAAAITAFIPDSVFTMFQDLYFLNILLIIVISTPMYICATGSIPIALSLLLKGISPGAAFVLLMAGPATNFAALFILKKEIGIRRTSIYLITIIVGAILCALLIDFAFPQQWFANLSSLTLCGHEHHGNHSACNHGPVWWQTTTSVIFVLLFLNAFICKWHGKKIHDDQ